MNGAKSDENNKFLTEWEPIHKKGLKSYAVPYLLECLFTITAMNGILFLILKPSNIKRVDYFMMINLFFFIIVIHGKVTEWYKKEKKYKDILALYETINKCPACSEEISPEDKICPSCGVVLGM